MARLAILLICSQGCRLQLFNEHTGDDEDHIEHCHAGPEEFAQLPLAKHDAHHSAEDHSQKETGVKHQVWRP